jgi:hypothetical protein
MAVYLFAIVVGLGVMAVGLKRGQQLNHETCLGRNIL